MERFRNSIRKMRSVQNSLSSKIKIFRKKKNPRNDFVAYVLTEKSKFEENYRPQDIR